MMAFRVEWSFEEGQLVELLIQTFHILEDDHFTVPNRRNPIVKGALVE